MIFRFLNADSPQVNSINKLNVSAVMKESDIVKKGKSQGLDGVPNNILKHLTPKGYLKVISEKNYNSIIRKEFSSI